NCADSAFFVVCFDSVDANSHRFQRFANPGRVAAAGKTNEGDLAAQLSEYSCHIASFAAGLGDGGPRSLYCSDPQFRKFQNSVDGKIGADYEQHGVILSRVKADPASDARGAEEPRRSVTSSPRRPYFLPGNSSRRRWR